MFPLIVSPTRTALLSALGLAKSIESVPFGLYTEWLPRSTRKEFANRRNVTLYPTVEQCVPALHKHTHLLTFGCTTAGPHRAAFRFAQAFAKIGKPRIDIQHGLFQEGYTLDFEGSDVLDTDRAVSWAEYGRLTDPLPATMIRDRKRIGIVSNLHWSRYTDQDRTLFLQCVRRICRAFPEYIVEWRPHLAEFAAGEDIHRNVYLIEPNLRILKFETVDEVSINRFLDRTDVVFSTPSTTIADCQTRRVPCIVFEAGKLDLRGQGTMAIARDPASITGLLMQALDAPSAFVPQVTGNRPFDIDAFVKLLESPDLRPSEEADRLARNFAILEASLRSAHA